MILLTVLSIVLVLIVGGVLWLALHQISSLLQEIGGPSTSSPGSVLAKIRWGVRAIERQTDALAPEGQRLAEQLPALEQALASLDRRRGGRA